MAKVSQKRQQVTGDSYYSPCLSGVLLAEAGRLARAEWGMGSRGEVAVSFSPLPLCTFAPLPLRYFST